MMYRFVCVCGRCIAGATLLPCMKVALSSDEEIFGGYKNITKDSDSEMFATNGTFDGRPHSFQVYAPCRTVVVYAPSEFCDKDAEGDEYGVPGLAVRGLGPYFEL